MRDKGEQQGLVKESLANSKAAYNLVFNEKVKALIKEGRDIAHFAFGQSPFPIPECLTKAVQEHVHVHDYLPMAGITELREALVRFHARYDDIKLQRENMVTGPGSKELIFLVFSTFSGDILLPSPAWTTYASQCRLAGKDPIILPTDASKGWKLAPGVLRAVVQEEQQQGRSSMWRLLILTNPGNPTGTCYTEEELRELGAVCRELKIIVLSDEIYGRLTFSRKFESMVKYYPEGTILTNGFSKWASAGGWRLGYAHFPSALYPLQEAVSNGASHTYSCAPAPMQYGVAKALKESSLELDRYMGDCARVLHAVSEFCYRELSSVGVGGVKSQAGYYYMADFEVVREGLKRRGITTSEQMSQAILKEADVAVMSSHPFLRPASELTTRFCFVCFDGSVALQALRTQPDSSSPLSEEFVREHCQALVRGVEKLKQWVVMNTVA
ncbi:aspartate aminotransferase-like [Eriocheir sinensis]|uniref:aspartate aminotransferase-like n=1 Tax=Eriocheir sinensis TaxID=95602 RepID=UPI0021C99EDC|nr:aspartate aminotransferase-like [Eriocheir sinensis]XP_050729869.1 aspartate aminotransferase-like [Eriocheir sinensis]